jgi:hypothetical protein
MLLRLCYVDVPGFSKSPNNVPEVQSKMGTAFKRGFMLRRKGHTGELVHRAALLSCWVL